jgi:hypothetical protein
MWWSLAPEKLDDNGPLTPRPVRLRLSTGETVVQMTSSTPAFIVWRPSSYSDEATVFSEAIDDVTAGRARRDWRGRCAACGFVRRGRVAGFGILIVAAT